MNTKKLLIFTLVLVLLVLATSAKKSKKSSSTRKFNNKDACACDSTFKPVCDTVSHTTYPSGCLAKCMGVKSSNLKKGACPVRVKKVVKNICKKSAKGKQFDQVSAQLLHQLIERTKQVEARLTTIQNRVGKAEGLKSVESEIKQIVSQIPATVAPVAVVSAAPVAPTPTPAPVVPTPVAVSAAPAPVAPVAAAPAAKKAKKANNNKKQGAGKKQKKNGSSKPKTGKKGGNKKKTQQK